MTSQDGFALVDEVEHGADHDGNPQRVQDDGPGQVGVDKVLHAHASFDGGFVRCAQ
jgi:hypothetical protein